MIVEEEDTMIFTNKKYAPGDEIWIKLVHTTSGVIVQGRGSKSDYERIKLGLRNELKAKVREKYATVLVP